jgi:hypothetical protein
VEPFHALLVDVVETVCGQGLGHSVHVEVDRCLSQLRLYT